MANRVVRQLDPAVGAAAGGATTFAYDDAGNKVETIDPTGAKTTYAHDDLGRMRTQTAVVRQAAPAGSFTSTYDYDDLGNNTVVYDPAGVVHASVFNAASERVYDIDGLWQITAFAYDSAGRHVSQTDPLNRSVVTGYDLAGRATSVAYKSAGPAGAVLATEWSKYDATGNLIEQRSARSASPTDNTYLRSYAYDAANRLSSISEPDNTTGTGKFVTQYGYNATGHVTRVQDQRGATAAVDFSYNPWGLRSKTIEPSVTGQTTLAARTYETAYDAAGLPDFETQPGATINYTFDELGRLTQEQGSGAGLATATRTFGYDLAGRRTSVNHPDGPITFSYDDRGLLLSASVPGSVAVASSFLYDAGGRMTARADAAGATAYQYDGRGDLWKVTDPLTGQVTQVTRDGARAVTQVSYGANATRTYGYDNRGRLASDVLKNGATVRASYAHTYDNDGNVLTQNIVMPGNAQAGNHTYAYDRAGRLKTFTKPGGPAVGYSYDAAGNRVTEGAGTFVYDKRNRLTTGPQGTYTWSARGTMTAGRTPAGGVQAYTFDALGRQTQVGATTYAYDGLDRLVDRSGTDVLFAGFEIDPVQFGTEKYARSPAGELVAAQKSAAATFVGENRHGDIGWYLNPTGTTAGTAVYDPWGKPTASGSSTTLGFQGDVTDPTTGQSWMGARWYDPGTAGFTARDTIFGQLQTPVTLNRYTYANNDPMQYFDPDGRAPWDGVTKSVGKAWDNTGGKVVTHVNRSVIEPTRRVMSSTYEAANAVIQTTRRAAGRTVTNVKATAVRVTKRTVEVAKDVGDAIAEPIRACIGSEACRTIVVGAAVVAGTILCTACTGAVLAGGLIGGGIGAATCSGDLTCIAQATVSGAAGGLFMPAGGAGLLATIGSGAAGGIAATGTNQAMHGRFDPKELALGGLLGGGLGGLFSGGTKAINTIRTARNGATKGAGGLGDDVLRSADDAFTHRYDYHPRIRARGVQDPLGHNFPYSYDDVILRMTPVRQADGSLLYRAPGSLNGKDGFFEIARNPDTGTIFHRTFVGA